MTKKHAPGHCPNCGSAMGEEPGILYEPMQDGVDIVLIYTCGEPDCQTVWNENFRLVSAEIVAVKV